MPQSFNVENFVSGRPYEETAAYIWGSGYTPETVPSAKGWLVKLAWQDGPILIGQRGKVGCVTVRRPSRPEGATLDVAIYQETPEAVRDARCANCDPLYIEIDDVPGWGRRVIQEIERDRLEYAVVGVGARLRSR